MPSRPTTALVTAILLGGSLLGGCGGSAPSADPAQASATPTVRVPSRPASTTHPVAPTYGTPGWSYLALGDSNVYGLPDDCGQCTTYPHLVRDALSEQSKTDVTLFDASQHNSLTGEALLAEIVDDDWGTNPDPLHDSSLSPRAAIAAADLITITVSANDIPWYSSPDLCSYRYNRDCVTKVERPFIAAIDKVLTQIDVIRGSRPTAVRLTTFYNDLIAGPGYDPTNLLAGDAIGQAKTSAHTFLNRWNDDLCATARAHGDQCVDVYHEVQGAEGLEPLPAGWFTRSYQDLNQPGHDQFASLIMARGFAPLG